MAVQRRNTRQRTLVLKAVRGRCDHPRAADIYRDVSAADPRVSRGTVYRNLRLLQEQGEIMCIKAPGGDRFDVRCDAHCHVICTACGAVADTSTPYDALMDGAVEDETGFAVSCHTTLFEGICPSCRALTQGA